MAPRTVSGVVGLLQRRNVIPRPTAMLTISMFTCEFCIFTFVLILLAMALGVAAAATAAATADVVAVAAS